MSIADKLTQIAENVPKVYDAGKQAEYDAFWDAYLENGNRTVYEGVFSGKGWNDSTFRPKYPITTVTYAYNMFLSCGVIDGYEYIKDIDTSKCSQIGQMYSMCYFEHIGTLDCSGTNAMNTAFNGARKLKIIDKIIVHKDVTFHSNCFNAVTTLEQVIFEGEIGQSGLDLQWSPKLNKASIESIINCLSTTTSGLTVTLSAQAVANAYEGGVESSEWKQLVASRSNWTIALV